MSLIRLSSLRALASGAALALAPQALQAQEPAPAAPASTLGANEAAPTSEPAASELAEATSAPAANRTRVMAGRVRALGDIVLVEGEEGRPVVVESGDLQAGGSRVEAQSVRINLAEQTLNASGQVTLLRSRLIERRTYEFARSYREDAAGDPIRPDTSRVPAPSADDADDPALRGGRERQRGGRVQRFFIERLQGSDLVFNGRTKQGSLDGALVQLSTFDISASNVLIEGEEYRARQVVLRPGGLSDEERKIYGTPPISLRAREIGVVAGSNGRTIALQGGGLYFGKTRLLPIRAAFLAPFATLNPSRTVPKFRIVPDVSTNSADRFLVTGRLSFALVGFPTAPRPGQGTAPSTSSSTSGRAGRSTTLLNLDLGLSARIGFRGGASLENRSPLGLVALQARRADIITTQLTNRLQVDRLPQISLDSPLVPVVRLRDRRGIGAFATLGAGRYAERLVGRSGPSTRSSRLSATVGLSTRVDERDGLYADLFATRSRYGLDSLSYSNTGFEVGYLGQLLPRVRGLVSLRRVGLSGSTPFRFDTVEIPRELRATFDIEATPRYLIPLDLRYDLDRDDLRDTTVGLLRNYKNFAYGLIYQTARRDLRLELRSNF